MSIREFAERVLLSESLEQKLEPPADDLVDSDPGVAVRVEWPGRPPELAIAPPGTTPKMPALGGLQRIQARAIAHHIMANHELQALEVMGMVVCAFPDAPAVPPTFSRWAFANFSASVFSSHRWKMAYCCSCCFLPAFREVPGPHPAVLCSPLQENRLNFSTSQQYPAEVATLQKDER